MPPVRLSATLAIALGLCGLSATAHAADPPVAQGMRPASSAESHITAESSQVLPAWTPSVGLVTTYGQLVGPAPDQKAYRIDRRTTSHLLFAFGLFDRAELDLGLPMVIHQDGSTPDSSPAGTLRAAAIGDLRVGAKGTILRTPERGFGLGIGFDMTVPTGNRDALTGEAGLTYAPQLYAEQRMARGIEAAINVGYFARPDVQLGNYVIGDAVTYRGALRVPFGPQLQVAAVGELDGAVGLVDGAHTPLVARGGIRWRMKSGVVLGLYGGGAVVNTLGVPDVHAMLSVNYVPAHRVKSERSFMGSPRPSATAFARRYERVAALDKPEPKPTPVDPRDPDGDRLFAQMDACPNVKEDLDGFEDGDGCPEWDNDRDGIRDAIDLCPGAPEVVNGYGDWDGCPDERFADGGRTMTKFDPGTVFPELSFAPGDHVLTQTDEFELDKLAELIRLNPWMGQLTVAVDVHVSEHEQGTLAKRRAQSVRDHLVMRGLDPWRVQVGETVTVSDAVSEDIRFALGPGTTGLRPLAPAPAAVEQMLANARDEGREEGERNAAATPDPSQHTGDPTPRIDPKGVDVMAQGPEEGQAPEEAKPEPKPESSANSTGEPPPSTRPLPPPVRKPIGPPPTLPPG